MKCPLCESTQFQDHGKMSNGDRKYLCLVCQTFFTKPILKNHINREKNKFQPLNINFIKSGNDQNKDNNWAKVFNLPTNNTSKFHLGLAIALILRLLLLFFPLAFWMDIAYFKDWSIALAQRGFSDFYNYSYCDYPPAYLYILWLIGKIYQFFDPTLSRDDLWFMAMIKLPNICADIGSAWLVAKILKPHTSLHKAYKLGLIYAFNPVILFVSAVWAQTDGVIIFFMLGAFYLIQKNHIIRAGMLIALSIITKPQGLFFVPFLVLSQWFRKSWKKWLTLTAFSLVLIWIIVLPFYGIKEHGLITPFLALYQRFQDTANRYDFASLNAFNIWGWANWEHDSITFLGISYKFIGLIFFASLIGWLGIFLYRQKHITTDALAISTLLVGCFMLPTRMHERYILYGLAFLLVTSTLIPRIKWLYLGFTLTATINVAFVYLRYNHESFFFTVPEIYTKSIVYIVSILNTIFFAFLIDQTIRSYRSSIPLDKTSEQYQQSNVKLQNTNKIIYIYSCIKSYFCSHKSLVTISILYQIVLVLMTVNKLTAYYPDISWDEALHRFSYNDSHHYVFLSQHGYQSNGKGVEFIVFPPFYPVMIYLFSFLLGNPYLAGLVISNIGSIIGHAAFAMFLSESGVQKPKMWRIMIILFLTPISIYFNMVYTEGLYLAETALLLYFLEKKRYSLAAIAGFCAALTRSIGIFCVIPYLAHCIENKLWKTQKYVLVQSLLIPMGTLIYFGINTWLFHDPFYYRVFLKNIWNKEVANPITLYIYNIGSIIKGDLIDTITLYIDQSVTVIFPIVVILYIISIIHKRKKISYGLILWSIAQWLVIASQSFWLSNTRYISLILPFYIMLEEIVGDFSISYWIILISFGSLAMYGIDLFARAQWVY